MKYFIALILTVLILGCSTPAKFKIEQSYSPEADVSALATYEILQSSPDKQIDRRYYDTLNKAVEKILAERGYQRAAGEVDFLVSATLNLNKEKIELQKGLYPSRHFEVSKPVQVFIEQGGIVIMIFDQQTGQKLFNGSATTNINRALAPETREERIGLATAQILSDFPDRK